MKKLLFMLALASASVGYANTPTSTDPVKEGEKPKTEVVVQAAEPQADEDLRCKYRSNKTGEKYSCWVCDCVAFIRAIKEAEADTD